MSLQDHTFTRDVPKGAKVLDLYQVGPHKWIEVTKIGAVVRRQVVTLLDDETAIKTPGTNASHEASHAVTAYRTHCWNTGRNPSQGFHVGGWHVRLVPLSSGFWGVFAVWDRQGFAHVQFFAEDGTFEAFTQSLESISNPFICIDWAGKVQHLS